MKAPLVAAISVGIAAAAPAVAISADTADTEAQRLSPGPPKTDLYQLVKPVTIEKPTKSELRHRRLVRTYLKLRKRANRLTASLRRRKPRFAYAAPPLRWSNRELVREIRRLRSRIKRLRAALRARRLGLTPQVKALLARIAACESGGNPRAIGGGGAFRGKYQFTYGAWQSVGGRGDPAAASEAEQDLRAAILYRRSGAAPWPVCGR